METIMLAAFLRTLGSIAMITVAFLLGGLILLQKNRGSGLSGAFGGVGGHTAFGTKTGDFLTWVTVTLAVLFLLLAILLNFAFEPKPTTAQAPVVTPVGVPGETPAETPAVPSEAPAVPPGG